VCPPGLDKVILNGTRQRDGGIVRSAGRVDDLVRDLRWADSGNWSVLSAAENGGTVCEECGGDRKGRHQETGYNDLRQGLAEVKRKPSVPARVRTAEAVIAATRRLTTSRRPSAGWCRTGPARRGGMAHASHPLAHEDGASLRQAGLKGGEE